METPQLHRCKYEEYVNTELYKAFKPIFISMKMFGLYFSRDYEVNAQGAGIPWRKKYTPSMIYSFLVLIGLILNFVRIFSMVFSVEKELGIAVFLGWMLLCIMNAISCFIGCVRYHAIPEFFLEWARTCPVMRENCIKRFKKLVIVLTVLCLIVTFLNVSFGIYNLLTSSSFDHYLFPMRRNDHGSLAMKIFVTVVNCYFSAAWTFPVALSYLVCHVLKNEFRFLGKQMAESTDFKRKSLSTNLEHYRWQHVKYTAMVGHANDFLTYHLAASCLINMVSCSNRRIP